MIRRIRSRERYALAHLPLDRRAAYTLLTIQKRTLDALLRRTFHFRHPGQVGIYTVWKRASWLAPWTPLGHVICRIDEWRDTIWASQFVSGAFPNEIHCEKPAVTWPLDFREQ